MVALCRCAVCEEEHMPTTASDVDNMALIISLRPNHFHPLGLLVVLKDVPRLTSLVMILIRVSLGFLS